MEKRAEKIKRKNITGQEGRGREGRTVRWTNEVREKILFTLTKWVSNYFHRSLVVCGGAEIMGGEKNKVPTPKKKNVKKRGNKKDLSYSWEKNPSRKLIAIFDGGSVIKKGGKRVPG